MNDNYFTPSLLGSMHACCTSVGTEISIPRTNMVYCVDNVSYSDGKIKVEYSFETRIKRKRKEKKEKGRRKSDIEEVVFLSGFNIFDVSRFLQEEKDTEPIIHLHQ